MSINSAIDRKKERPRETERKKTKLTVILIKAIFLSRAHFFTKNSLIFKEEVEVKHVNLKDVPITKINVQDLLNFLNKVKCQNIH